MGCMSRYHMICLFKSSDSSYKPKSLLNIVLLFPKMFLYLQRLAISCSWLILWLIVIFMTGCFVVLNLDVGSNLIEWMTMKGLQLPWAATIMVTLYSTMLAVYVCLMDSLSFTTHLYGSLTYFLPWQTKLGVTLEFEKSTVCFLQGPVMRYNNNLLLFQTRWRCQSYSDLQSMQPYILNVFIQSFALLWQILEVSYFSSIGRPYLSVCVQDRVLLFE